MTATICRVSRPFLTASVWLGRNGEIRKQARWTVESAAEALAVIRMENQRRL